MKNKKVVVIGSGFAGLATACCLAKEGIQVTLIEKNRETGGRARSFEAAGFMFDMGPSWYWMPDVFEQFFGLFGKKASDYYSLQLLEPSFSVFFGKNDKIDIPSNPQELEKIFDSLEPGSSFQLRKFLAEAQYKYEVSMKDLVFKRSYSWLEYMDKRILKAFFKLHLLQPFSKYVRKYFKHPKLLSLLEFPVLFLGAQPKHTPALYSMMNYAGLSLGTWYPMGGMKMIVEGMENLAKSLGVQMVMNCPVKEIIVKDNKVTGVIANHHFYAADAVVATSDYHHTEQLLQAPELRNYTENYWQNRTMAPSALLFYLGVNKKIDALQHHNLFFDEDFELHAKEIYETKQHPSKPLFYVCCPSKTDASVAPNGKENLFVLMPIAAGLDDTEGMRNYYYQLIMDRMESITGEKIKVHIVYEKSYCVKDFISDYNAFKGNAYGLANTLRQTAVLKPKLKNNQLNNLFYAGQLTVPGPGVPPALISAQIVSHELINHFKLKQ